MSNPIAVLHPSRTAAALLALAASLPIGSANAALHARDIDPAADGIEAWYDDVLHITWQANANLSRTEQFGVAGIGVHGGMDGFTAKSWIGQMNDAGYLGYSDWRLPRTFPLDASGDFNYGVGGDVGYSVGAPGTPYAGSTASEMAHLYYTTLGNPPALPTGCSTLPSTACLINPGPFDYGNLFVPGGGVFWSASSAHGHPAGDDYVFTFDFLTGYQGAFPIELTETWVWAVRDGDVITAVPEADTWALMLAGLAAGASLLRKRGHRRDS